MNNQINVASRRVVQIYTIYKEFLSSEYCIQRRYITSYKKLRLYNGNFRYITRKLFDDKNRNFIAHSYKLFSTAECQVPYTTDDVAESKDDSKVNYNTQFTNTCGELSLADIGKKVKLCGWVRYVRMDKFLLLRDMHGIIQIFVPPDKKELRNIVSKITLESTICVEGIVRARPDKDVNSKLRTGHIEISALSIDIICKAVRSLPIHIYEFNKAQEKLLNQYRPLALRMDEYKAKIILYAQLESRMRYFLDKNNFINIPTPTLFKPTPGGAQEFIVPTQDKDRYYSLVQSPQQFKQMLMIGGFDRYYQFARCYRDERTSPDRQPEFNQLDIEMSFTTVDGVIKLIEDVLHFTWPKDAGQITVPFPRISYQEAMQSYGSDKPYMLNVMKVINLSEFIASAVSDNAYYMIIVPNSQVLDEIKIKSIRDNIQHFNTDISCFAVLSDINESISQLSNIIPSFQIDLFKRRKIPLKEGDIIVVSHGLKTEKVLTDLGVLRKEILKILAEDSKSVKAIDYEFFWVVDFPLFIKSETDDNEFVSAHHVFTQPHPSDIPLLRTDPLKVKALHYDLVLNGCEIGGGSIRIHDPELQSEIFKLLKLSEDNFSHLINFMKFGCPSMGGIALGMERLVMLISKANSIREVIAFPKGSRGQDLMTNAPCDISEQTKILYHLNSQPMATR